MRENPLGGKRVMPIKRYKPEQIVTMLRQIEVSIANGKTTPQACKEAEIVLVQPELERRRCPLVSIPPLRAGIFKASGSFDPMRFESSARN
jgi:hypothetical protein